MSKHKNRGDIHSHHCAPGALNLAILWSKSSGRVGEKSRRIFLALGAAEGMTLGKGLGLDAGGLTSGVTTFTIFGIRYLAGRVGGPTGL